MPRLSSMRLGLGLLGALLPALAGHGRDPRPNILLITSEDSGPQIGCYGEPAVKTPHLDALVRNGVRFSRAFDTQAGCSQGRSSILTGLYPHQSGQIGLATWGFRMFREKTPNLVQSLKDAGYRTGLIGKLHVNPESAFPFMSHQVKTPNFQREDLEAYERHAAHFLRASDQPFLLMVNYPDAHRPFLPQVGKLPAQPLRGAEVRTLASVGIDTPEFRQQTADYLCCLERFDTLIGRLLEALSASGKAQNTIVIYLADHGQDLLRGKRTCFEGGLHIPLIVSWQRGGKPGQVRSELVSQIDLFPTILEAVGVPRPPGLPGLSLVPLLKGETVAWREYLFAEWHLHSVYDLFPQRSVRDGRYKLIHNLITGADNPGFAWTMKTFYPELEVKITEGEDAVAAAYRRMKRPPDFELYDLEKDPNEWRDLAADAGHREVLDRLKRELSAWRSATNDPLLRVENLRRLQEEVDSFLAQGNPRKSADIAWKYPDYLAGGPRLRE